jgi:hypothetical protein
LEDLREKREDLHRSLLRDEEEKVRGRNVNAQRCVPHHASAATFCAPLPSLAPFFLDCSPRCPQARIQKELTALTERLERAAS